MVCIDGALMLVLIWGIVDNWAGFESEVGRRGL